MADKTQALILIPSVALANQFVGSSRLGYGAPVGAPSFERAHYYTPEYSELFRVLSVGTRAREKLLDHCS